MTFHITNTQGIVNEQLVDMTKAGKYMTELEKLKVKYYIGKVTS